MFSPRLNSEIWTANGILLADVERALGGAEPKDGLPRILLSGPVLSGDDEHGGRQAWQLYSAETSFHTNTVNCRPMFDGNGI